MILQVLRVKSHPCFFRFCSRSSFVDYQLEMKILLSMLQKLV